MSEMVAAAAGGGCRRACVCVRVTHGAGRCVVCAASSVTSHDSHDPCVHACVCVCVCVCMLVVCGVMALPPSYPTAITTDQELLDAITSIPSPNRAKHLPGVGVPASSCWGMIQVRRYVGRVALPLACACQAHAHAPRWARGCHVL